MRLQPSVLRTRQSTLTGQRSHLCLYRFAYGSAKRQQAWQRFSALLDKMQDGNAQFSEEEAEADVLKAVEEVLRGKH